MLGLCGMLTIEGPGSVFLADGAVGYEGIGIQTSSSYKIKVDAPSLVVYNDRSVVSGRIAEVSRDQIMDVISYENGWALISDDSLIGYVKISDGATLVETTKEKVDERAALRDRIVEYALQFVGRPYVWGGVDPNRGADCSGFTAYVMRQVAGVNLTHSSVAQAGEGKTVNSPQAGDLIFYSKGGRINHVAIYIGDGLIVHASSEKTGIKISDWTYRKATKIVDVLP